MVQILRRTLLIVAVTMPVLVIANPPAVWRLTCRCSRIGLPCAPEYSNWKVQNVVTISGAVLVCRTYGHVLALTLDAVLSRYLALIAIHIATVVNPSSLFLFFTHNIAVRCFDEYDLPLPEHSYISPFDSVGVRDDYPAGSIGQHHSRGC